MLSSFSNSKRVQVDDEERKYDSDNQDDNNQDELYNESLSPSEIKSIINNVLDYDEEESTSSSSSSSWSSKKQVVQPFRETQLNSNYLYSERGLKRKSKTTGFVFGDQSIYAKPPVQSNSTNSCATQVFLSSLIEHNKQVEVVVETPLERVERVRALVAHNIAFINKNFLSPFQKFDKNGEGLKPYGWLSAQFKKEKKVAEKYRAYVVFVTQANKHLGRTKRAKRAAFSNSQSKFESKPVTIAKKAILPMLPVFKKSNISKLATTPSSSSSSSSSSKSSSINFAGTDADDEGEEQIGFSNNRPMSFVQKSKLNLLKKSLTLSPQSSPSSSSSPMKITVSMPVDETLRKALALQLGNAK